MVLSSWNGLQMEDLVLTEHSLLSKVRLERSKRFVIIASLA